MTDGSRTGRRRESVGFGSHVRVRQLLAWRKVLLESGVAEAVTGPLPPEWALRPLTEAKTQGRLDDKQAAAILKQVTAGGSKTATHSEVEEAVQKVAKPKDTPARKMAEPEQRSTFPATSSARVLIEIDTGTLARLVRTSDDLPCRMGTNAPSRSGCPSRPSNEPPRLD